MALMGLYAFSHDVKWNERQGCVPWFGKQ